jgi:hypothetical protein
MYKKDLYQYGVKNLTHKRGLNYGLKKPGRTTSGSGMCGTGISLDVGNLTRGTSKLNIGKTARGRAGLVFKR